VYEAYWYFAAERQQIFLKRLQGAKPPYTNDKILQTYKFCNVFRATDRVSQFLIRDVIYSGKDSAKDQLFRILLFRLLNRNQSWLDLEETVGRVSTLDFSFDRYDRALHALREKGPIYGNAFILCANKVFGHAEKHRNHLALLEHIFIRTEIWKELVAADSLQELFERLRSLPLLGDFMAYQMAIDLNYSELFCFSENDFTVAGPGAKRGIAKCFTDVGSLTSADVIQWMVEHQQVEFARLGLDFGGLFGRPLHAIDCQGLFCETDKYCRVKFPELASNRVRIKASFTENLQPITYFFPPKWGIEVN